MDKINTQKFNLGVNKSETSKADDVLGSLFSIPVVFDEKKTNGKIIISTINRNSLSRFLTIYLGENVLNWIPKGTHDYNKFIKPEEINIAIKKIKLKSDNLKGLTFNPIVNEWYMSNSVKVNYFCTLKNI